MMMLSLLSSDDGHADSSAIIESSVSVGQQRSRDGRAEQLLEAEDVSREVAVLHDGLLRVVAVVLDLELDLAVADPALRVALLPVQLVGLGQGLGQRSEDAAEVGQRAELDGGVGHPRADLDVTARRRPTRFPRFPCCRRRRGRRPPARTASQMPATLERTSHAVLSLSVRTSGEADRRRPRAGDQAGQAVGGEDQDGDDRGAVEEARCFRRLQPAAARVAEERKAAAVVVEDLRQRADEQGARDRAADRAEAADDDHHQEIDRQQEAERLGHDAAERERQQDAGEPGVHRRHRERGRTVDGHVDAHDRCRDRAVADRQQRPSGPRRARRCARTTTRPRPAADRDTTGARGRRTAPRARRSCRGCCWRS